MDWEQENSSLWQLIEKAPDAVFVADLNGRYTYVNEAAVKLLGYDREELMGKTIFDLIPPEEKDRLEKEKTHMMQPGIKQLSEWKLKKKDGGYLDVEVHADILPDGRWQAFVRDITERKKVEKALRDSERSFRLLTECLPLGVWLIDEAGKIVYGNPAGQKIWEGARYVKTDEFSEYKAWWYDTGKLIEPHEWAAARAIEKGETSTAEVVKIQRFDGSFGIILNWANPIVDENGIVVGALIMNQDITLAKQQEKEHEQLQKQVENEKIWLEAVFQHAPLGIVMVYAEDPEHPVPNEIAMSAFGRIDWKKGRSGYIGIACNAFGSPLSQDELTSSRLIRGEIINSEEQMLRFADGKKMPILVSGGPISDKTGKIMGAVAFFQDITRQKELEDAIRKSEAKAKEEARMRQEIVSIVSHDLKNPLTTIIMATDLLKSDIEEQHPQAWQSTHEMTAMIENAASIAINLVKNLLDMAKVESGNFSIKKSEVSFDEIAKFIYNVLTPLAQKKGVELEVNFEKDQKFSADSERLFQVFSNLIGNAIKFTPRSGKIRVGVQKEPQSVTFFVSDTGYGIPHKDLEHVFDRYWQAKETGAMGAGLGLYIAKNIIEAHGGTIRVDSELGRGTTFYVTIPAMEMTPISEPA